jgi:hypothetical protein
VKEELTLGLKSEKSDHLTQLVVKKLFVVSVSQMTEQLQLYDLGINLFQNSIIVVISNASLNERLMFLFRDHDF